jgi:dimethylargininase
MNFYKNAICRLPNSNAASGQTSVDLGVPDFQLLQNQHRTYIDQLKTLGLEVTVLEPLEEFPDAYFPEDVAIVTPEIAVITRPGALTRRGETAYIEPILEKFRNLVRIEQPGTLDGGDVLIVGKHCVVGLSERTNRHGAEQLQSFLADFGYKTDIVVVSEALHFKSSVNFLDENTLLVTQSCYELDCLSEYRKCVVPEGEEYAANVVWINGHILVPTGFEGTQRLLQENGYSVISMPVSEIEKMDGGLTCLSLRLE